MRATEDALLILGLNILGMITTYAAPLSSPKTDWEKGVNFAPVITSDCSPNARCLEVLPLEPVATDTIVLPEDIPPTRYSNNFYFNNVLIEVITFGESSPRKTIFR